MNGFNNPYANRKPKDLWNSFYRNQKVLVWIMGISLLGLVAVGTRFFTIIYLVYLIYFGGILFKQYFNDEKLIKAFSFGGLSGTGVYLLIFSSSIDVLSIVPVFIGSGALALLTAAATYAPNQEVVLALFGKVKIKWLAIILIAIDLLTINPSHPTDRVSDLGGVIFGFLLIYLPARKTFGKGIDFGTIFRKKGPYYKKSKKRKSPLRSQTIEKDEDYNARKKQEQKEIDKILEKIKLKGYESLSAQEKRKLFDQSKR